MRRGIFRQRQILAVWELEKFYLNHDFFFFKEVIIRSTNIEATLSLLMSGHFSLPFAVINVTSFSFAPKPAMPLAIIQSQPLRLRLSAAFLSVFSLSAAKPMTS